MKKLVTTFAFCFMMILTFQNAYSDDWREARIWIYVEGLSSTRLLHEHTKVTEMNVKVKYKNDSFICNVPMDRIAKIEIKETQLDSNVTDRTVPDVEPDKQVVHSRLVTNYEYKITGFKNQTQTCSCDKNNIKKIIIDDGFKILEFNIGQRCRKGYFKKLKEYDEWYDPHGLLEDWMKECRSQIRKIEFKN